jgi:D-alanyl-D-alanine dipeptidase
MKTVISGFLLGLLALGTQAQVKVSAQPLRKAIADQSLQILVVSTSGWNDFQGKAQLMERASKGSPWQRVGASFPVVLGRNGLGLDSNIPAARVIGDKKGAQPPVKQEGDGRSPAGAFPLTFAFGVGPAPKTSLPFTLLQEFTECVDDVKSNHYNTIVDRMQVGDFDWASSEKMLSVGEAYERGVFVAYNSYPPIRGDGSCIFLHVWKNADTGTAGCTAMKRSDLEWLLARLDPSKTPYLYQLPDFVNQLNEKPWKLPKLK